MAYGSTIGSPPSNDDYQAHCDYEALMCAAEIMADRIRVREAIKYQAKKQKAMITLSSMLAKYKSAPDTSGVVNVRRGRGPTVVVNGPDSSPKSYTPVSQINYVEA